VLGTVHDEIIGLFGAVSPAVKKLETAICTVFVLIASYFLVLFLFGFSEANSINCALKLDISHARHKKPAQSV